MKSFLVYFENGARLALLTDEPEDVEKLAYDIIEDITKLPRERIVRVYKTEEIGLPTQPEFWDKRIRVPQQEEFMKIALEKGKGNFLDKAIICTDDPFES